MHRITHFIVLAVAAFVPALALTAATNHVVITEFMALNSTVKADADGDFSDWIELYNPGETSVDLTGWHLTDEAGFRGKWTFPSSRIGAGQYLLFWASGKDKVAGNGEIHTNFKLSGSGEYLALVEPDTNAVSYEYAPAYPAQQSNVSYGLYQGQQTFFMQPTPGSSNALGTQILSPVFSMPRGFYSAPFNLSLTVSDPTAVIRYTLDGIRPTATVGNVYKAPLTLSGKTPVSAVCVKNGVVSPVVSNTYIFTSDVVNQPAEPQGYPTEWGTSAYNYYNSGILAGKRVPADYEMDPEVCKSTEYKALMNAALTSIPTLSIVTNPSYLFSYSINPDTGGIYIYTGDVAKDSYNTSNTKLGVDWERPASVEYFDPADNSQFQLNCALLLHGGNGRKAYNTPKHSFRLSFRSDYGPSKLNFKVFDEKKATDRFDHLIVRASLNYSWLHNSEAQRTGAQNLTDAFSRKLQQDMGQVSGHDKFVHIYLNGLYWGVYDLTEKFNNDFMSSYLGGDDADYDVVNDDVLVDGVLTTYTAMTTDALAGKYSNLVADKKLDCTNFIDYMLMNYYIGNVDWDKNNWFTARNRITPDNGFRYFSWDAETSLTDVAINRVTLLDGMPTKMLNALKADAEFKMLLADRIQKHFFNGGALTAENTVYRYAQMAGRFDTAMIAESARWGDFGRDVAKYTGCTTLYGLNNAWIPRRDYLLNTYFPTRTATVFGQLQAAGFFPSVEAPTFNTRGGDIEQPVQVTLSAPAGTIYYTVDGSDPRIYGGSLNGSALLYSKALTVVGRGTLKARAKSGTVWSAINEISFKSADTLHFVGDGNGLPLERTEAVADIYYAEGSLHYQLPVDGVVGLRIYTLDGRSAGGFEPLEDQAGARSFACRLNAGVYLYRFLFNGIWQTGKVMVP
jgi:hypothetical protein